MQELLQHAWLLDDRELDSMGVGKGDEEKIFSLLGQMPRQRALIRTTYDEVDNPLKHLLQVLRKPENFFLTAKLLFNITLLPFQLVILRELWFRPFPMLIGSRGLSKSFLLAFYIMLRLMVQQGVKVVVVGAAFRQAKVVFEYCEMIWANAPVLRDACSGGKGRNNREQGPRRDIDRCEVIIGDSIAIFLPLGDGKKIRGQRANIIVCEEFASTPPDIYETVVAGFASTTQDPVGGVQDHAKQRMLQRLGLWEKSNTVQVGSTGNQSIISGTAYYSFNWFAKYWNRYKGVIESRGDPHKLRELQENAGTGDDSDLPNWKDYSIIRIPVDLLPPGFMDAKHISRARMTITKAIFEMEYGACVVPGGEVITADGMKAIEEVRQGDLVLTHRGRFRPVQKVYTRHYEGNVVDYKTFGCGLGYKVTVDHPYWQGGEDWLRADEVTLGQTRLANLRELNGVRELDVRAVVKDYREHNGKIYPRPSQSKFSNEQIELIRSSPKTGYALAKEWGVNVMSVLFVRRSSPKPKNAIPAVIPLDYSFGLILGYYAAEGSTGANGRAASFSLDGHVNEKLASYVDQLKGAIEQVFGFAPKLYKHDESVTNVTINQRLVVDLLKAICPGVADTKFIDPAILFSNEELLKGFVIGYWNGDGHLPNGNDAPTIAASTSKCLLTQVRLAISYFGITSTISMRELGTAVFRGKEHQCKPSYVLHMQGQQARMFQHQFYGRPLIDTGYKPNMSNDGLCAILPVRSRKIEPYVGPVYNLEVEEDHSYSLLNATVHNCFSADSDGFFRRSLIESCVAGNADNDIPFKFSARLKGEYNRKHVIAVDPAAQSDNFAIVVLALHENHRRVVYCWTTRKKQHEKLLKLGLVKESNFWAFCARKIRELLRSFPSTVKIAVDAQGGGLSVQEALHDEDKLEVGEVPIWPVIDPDPRKRKDSDGKKGLHILEMIEFADGKWVSEANHGLKKDFHDKAILFPYLDPALLGLSIEDDKANNRVYDTLEDATMEIEALKDELASIRHEETATGRERWDTPRVKTGTGITKEGRLRKDRYSALLMANMIARQIARSEPQQEYESVGGWKGSARGKSAGPLYVFDGSWAQQEGGADDFGKVVRR